MKTTKLGKYGWTIIVSIFSIMSLYPLLWMLFQSLKTETEFFQNPFGIPTSFEWINFLNAWENANFSIYYKNSIIVTVTTTFLIVLVCSLNGYALAKIKFRGKKIVLGTIISVLFLPGSMLLFPVYMIARNLGIIGTYPGLIGPYVAGAVPIATLIFMNAFSDIPDELVESAKIDGCGHFRIWSSIMMPLVKSSIATVCIVNGMAVWNEFLWALMTLTKKERFTLPVGLHDIADQAFRFGYGTVFAGMVMTTLPIIIIYAFSQKHFVKAVTAGAVKG